MKSLLRWCATLGLVGSTVIGTWLSPNLEAFALPDEQVIQKLRQIPVFTIADSSGAPLVASQGDQGRRVAGVFISQQDAQEFLEQLRQEQPELAGQVQVMPVSLGEIYQLDQQQASALDFAFVPAEEQVRSAVSLLEEQGQQIEENQLGVPLFVARGGEEQGYLTIERDENQVIPFFFDRAELEQILERFKQQKPELADTVQIEVVTLQSVLQTLQSQDNEDLEKIEFVPSREALEFLRSRSRNQ